MLTFLLGDFSSLVRLDFVFIMIILTAKAKTNTQRVFPGRVDGVAKEHKMQFSKGRGERGTKDENGFGVELSSQSQTK